MTRKAAQSGTKQDAAEAIVGTAPAAEPTAGVRVELTNAELVQLQLRVIALENLVTALLATAPEQTAVAVRTIAADISPRPDSTPHRLTVRAAAQMLHLLERGQLARNSAPAHDG